MAFFETIASLPEDPIFGLTKIFNSDPRQQKVNLGVGAYQDFDGRTSVLAAVKEAEELILSKSLSKNYLPIDGNREYNEETVKLAFGSECPRFNAGEIFFTQTIGGCGALRIGADFLTQEISRVIFLSDPSWPNHKGIFSRAKLNVDYYRYYDEVNHRVDFDGFCVSLKLMPPGSVILLQACCHNPTGMDLSFEQWQILSELIKKHQLLPFFDFAYQGFGQDIETDAKPIRYFAEQEHEMLVAQSFSKNFGLYGERVGVLSIVTKNSKAAQKIGSAVRQIVRESYSNPPLHGARIVETILKTPSLKNKWLNELQLMRNRIKEMRDALTRGLMDKSPTDFSFFKNQKGLFSFSGLNKQQVLRLREEKGIYMIDNGRINVAGLTPSNIDYVIQSILSVLAI
jgi:aspartate aminotransferase